MRRTFAVYVFASSVLGLGGLALGGCTTRAVGPGHDTGVGGGGDDTGGGGGGDHDAQFVDTGITGGGRCGDGNARWIYLVDSNNAFLRYEPDSGNITSIGTLACPAAAGATPFSMAVARDATAYVLYSGGGIFAVSTTDASCTRTDYQSNQMGFQLFGMGFVSDVAGGDTETLFIAGGGAGGIGMGSATLGSMHPSDWVVSTIGPVGGSPELTGNGLGELWGFFPDSTPMSVQRLDKTTGSPLDVWDVSSIRDGRASAWAFAYWGGRYYMFYQGATASSTGIYRLTPDTSVVEPVMLDIGYRIVGAGVSTCAPTILI
ncbi:MAG: hypothetical protein U0234_18095 [Sandaracinus sp.]